MVVTGPGFRNKVCNAAYARYLGDGLSYKERGRLKTPCDECGELIANWSMRSHKKSNKCMRNRVNFTPSIELQAEIERNNLQLRTPANPPDTYNISMSLNGADDIQCRPSTRMSPQPKNITTEIYI